jgi:hypothetical protein
MMNKNVALSAQMILISSLKKTPIKWMAIRSIIYVDQKD